MNRMMRTRRASSSALLCCTALLLLSLLLCFQQASAHGGIDDGDDTPPVADGQRSKGLIAVKVWCLVILFAFTFLSGVSPYFYRWNEAFLLLGTQFAAGVFLGTALMHFLADSASTFHGLAKNNHYPFAYMLACVGFLLTMLADCGIAAVASRGRRAISEEEQHRHNKDDHHPMLVRTSSLEDAILLIFALCFHSIFEGIAIGVSATKSDAWRNLWTIGLHKMFAAAAMGIALLRMIPKRPFLMTVAYSLAFAVSSPVGVGIGIGIDATAEGRAADWTYAISMGLATGIFVYVAINHLMAKGYRPNEPTRADRPSLKFLAVLLGAAVMAVVMIWD